MSINTVLEIEDRLFIRGRGVVLIPEAFVFVSPNGIPKPFSDSVTILRPDGTSTTCEANFHIEHFSIKSGDGGLAGRYSLVLEIADRTLDEVPAGSQVSVSESVLDLMNQMVKWPYVSHDKATLKSPKD